jgi:acyl-homoserine lactone acylase PvdQ
LLRRVLLGVVLATLWLAPGAAAGVPPYGQGSLGDFNDILPPGQGSQDNLGALLAYEANHSHRPAHWTDQLRMYSRLTTAAPHIRSDQINQFFKDSTFGVPPGEVASVEHPAPGVTIERDRAFGVPHIYGTTRAALEFGIGWASAEDRLFMMDVLRHVGEGTLASFAGGSNVGLDETSWTNAPYTQRDLQRQIAWAEHASPYSGQILSDARSYIKGINAYIKAGRRDPLMMPGEYLALGYPTGPALFNLGDLISIASVIGAELGKGGGHQLQNALLYEAMRRRFGGEHYEVAGSPAVVHRARRSGPFGDHSGYATFESFVDPADPEAPTTVQGHSFPYQTLPMPSAATRRTIALPDEGSVRMANPVVSGSVPSSAPLASDAGEAGAVPEQIAAARAALLGFPHTMSNALVVGREDSATHHPLAVMGPQVSYFSPEILMEEDIHGPGISAEGAAFPGTNLYVEVGHGNNYAWSATSAGQNIIDTFAVTLCNPAGGRAAQTSDHYLLRGRCVPMQTLLHHESWRPNIADSTPAGSVTFRVQRTAFGLVIARARIDGQAVAYTNLRSTYMHELDSVLGFYLLNSPKQMTDVESFLNAASNIDYTFNWFFANPHHIAYYNSGLNPIRAPNTDPLFPSWARYAWRDYHGGAQLTPAGLTEARMHVFSHPFAVDQPYLTSWNNKQAPGYNDAATGQEFSSVYRSQLLDLNIRHFLRVDHGKLSLADLINAMGNAGTQDLRGVEVLPYALRIIGHPRGLLGRDAALLRAWVRTGAHRINRLHPGSSGSYQNSTAVRLMDAWWPLLVRAEFQPVLGPALLNQLEGDFPINDPPGHVGSSWAVGFYGIVQKDLRAVLGEQVRGPLNRVYCGRGSLVRCRRALENSLRRAAAESPQRVYPAGAVCAAGDQMCADSIEYRATGVIGVPGMEWINRPTFQQADVLTGCPELFRHGRSVNVCPPPGGGG